MGRPLFPTSRFPGKAVLAGHCTCGRVSSASCLYHVTCLCLHSLLVVFQSFPSLTGQFLAEWRGAGLGGEHSFCGGPCLDLSPRGVASAKRGSPSLSPDASDPSPSLAPRTLPPDLGRAPGSGLGLWWRGHRPTAPCSAALASPPRPCAPSHSASHCQVAASHAVGLRSSLVF